MESLDALETEFRDKVVQREEALRSAKIWFSGGVAGCVGKTCTAPLSRVCVLMQVQSMRPRKYHRKGVPNNLQLIPSIQKVIKEEGFRHLWRGNGAAMLHRFPHSGAIFMVNGAIKKRLPNDMHPSIVSIIAGGLASATGNTVAYPFDVIKTRLSAQSKTIVYKGIIDCARHIQKEEGIKGIHQSENVDMEKN